MTKHRTPSADKRFETIEASRSPSTRATGSGVFAERIIATLAASIDKSFAISEMSDLSSYWRTITLKPRSQISSFRRFDAIETAPSIGTSSSPPQYKQFRRFGGFAREQPSHSINSPASKAMFSV